MLHYPSAYATITKAYKNIIWRFICIPVFDEWDSVTVFIARSAKN